MLSQNKICIKKEAFTSNYCYTDTGENNKIWYALDCWEQIYFYLMSEKGLTDSKYFVDDIRTQFHINSNYDFFSRCTKKSAFMSSAGRKRYVRPADPFSQLLSLFYSGKSIAFSTDFSKLKGYYWNECPPSAPATHHVAYFVGFDQQDLYIVDSPEMFSKNCDIVSHFNKAVHKIEKKGFECALEEYCVLYEVFIDCGKMESSQINIDETVFLPFIKSYEDAGKSDVITGKSSLLEMRKILHATPMSEELADYLKSSFPMHLIAERRHLLLLYLKDASYDRQLIEGTEKNYKCWSRLKSLFQKYEIDGLERTYQKLVSAFEDILREEQTYVRLLQNYVGSDTGVSAV